MKRRLSLLTTLALCAGIAWGQDDGAARIAERLKVPHATMPRLKETPTMDAVPDFKTWAGPLDFRHLAGLIQKPPLDTRGYLARDEQHIYLAVRCEDPAAKEVAAKPAPLDDDVWASDSAEFMLLPGHDPEQPYYHFAVNPAGSLYDAKVKDKTWNSGAKVFTAVDATGWLAVIRVPLAALGVKEGERPALWRVNLHRSRPMRADIPALDLAWSPTHCAQNHVPERFGVVACDSVKPLDAAAEAAILKILQEQLMSKGATLLEEEIALRLIHGPDNPRNSEGSFVTLTDGRILFAYSRYYGEGGGYDGDRARICGRFSADGGRTWSGTDAVLVENEGKHNVMSVSLLRLQDGRIALAYLRKNSPEDCRLMLRTSSDEGKTWSDATLCIPPPGYFVVNNDRMIQLQSGRLVVPAGLHRAKSATGEHLDSAIDSRSIIMFFLSDDAGKTWREAKDWWALPVRSTTGLQEPGVIELPDGRLYAYSRTDQGCQYELFSEDGGETWTPPRPSPFRGPAAPLSIKRIPGTDALLAVWNDYSGRMAPVREADNNFRSKSWGRTPLVSAISRDGGKTWEQHTLLEADPERGFCYIAIHFAGDAVLLAYCCGGGGKGTVLQDTCIRRVPLARLYSADRKP